MMGLEENVLDARKEAYIAWLVTPKPDRDPDSKAKYAVAAGVSEQTLRRWEKEQVFREEWQKRADSVIGSPERHQSVLDVLYANALQGDVKAADLYLRVTGKLAPPTVKVEDGRKAATLTDAELDALIAQQAEAEAKKRQVA